MCQCLRKLDGSWGILSPQGPVASGHKELLFFVTLSHTGVPGVSVEKVRKHPRLVVLTLREQNNCG